MNAEVKSLPQQSQLKINQMLVAGRVESVEEYDDNYYSTVVLPAADAYSQPSVLKVKSSRKIGKAGEDVRVEVSWHGWLKKGDKGGTFLNGFFVAAE